MTQTATPRAGNRFERSDYVLFAISLAAVLLAFLTRGQQTVFAFVCAAAAVAVLAAVVGRSVEQLGDRFGPGATGVLQSALGNLPELFIALFALRAGLVGVVQAALIGSILANLLLVMGLCFVVGGLKHGAQKLDSGRAQFIGVMLLVSVAAMVFPSVAAYVHTPAEPHETTLSMIAAVVLLVLFALSLPASIRKSDQPGVVSEKEPPRWTLPVAIGLLAVAAVAAAFVSDWFVAALQPAMQALNISEAFSGLVIVAIAGNAIENVVGLQLAARNESEVAFAVVINSPLQIALVLAPVLVIASTLLGFTPLTLVFSPMLVVAVLLAVVLAIVITFDGRSNWLEGAALVGLYCIIAASFWWG